jgi:hypothetical protein
MASKEALLHEALSDSKVRCNLCVHPCVIFDGRKGICQVRENRVQRVGCCPACGRPVAGVGMAKSAY